MKKVELEKIATEIATREPDYIMFPNCDEKDVFVQGFTSGIEYMQCWIPISECKPEIGKQIILKGNVRVYGNGKTKYEERIMGITELQENGEYNRRLLPFYNALTDEITSYRYLNLID